MDMRLNGRLSMTWNSSSWCVGRPGIPSRVLYFSFVLKSERNFYFEQVAYQRILQLTYVEDLLVAAKALFVELFQPFLSSFVASLHAIGSAKLASSPSGESGINWDFAKALADWDKYFDKLLRTFEEKAIQVSLCASK
jgi:carbohydrate-binding DOMON domain-containing protein